MPIALVEEGARRMKKKPDLLVLLAMVIGMGVLVTELAYGTMSSDDRTVTAQVSQSSR
jgi:hypothetical protein